MTGPVVSIQCSTFGGPRVMTSAIEEFLDAAMSEAEVRDDGQGIWTASHVGFQRQAKSAEGHAQALHALRALLRAEVMRAAVMAVPMPIFGTADGADGADERGFMERGWR